eukprot:scaffold389250_cov42-Prasinocladus_malaysianus.AAC.3
MSYESCRADIAWLEGTRWLYVVLGEGHIIKSAKTKARLGSLRAAIYRVGWPYIPFWPVSNAHAFIIKG